MSRGPFPLLLMLAMSLPGAARALGLGDIRIDSALNEPLSAQIDIVGATRDDLIALTAKVANREIFQRFGAERPSFLSSATFKVGTDAQGRPVLNIRSAEAFTDPVVSLLVELRWGNGALVRDYSLLLDPAGLAASRAPLAADTNALARMTAAAASPARATSSQADSPPRAVTAEPAMQSASAQHTTATTRASGLPPPIPVAPGAAAASLAMRSVAPEQPQVSPRHHRVAARDTLRGIARRAGARSEADAQRMMMAIFRANPHAFDGNINRIHEGALLNIPSRDAVRTLDTAEAQHDYRTHMTSWRLDGRPAAQRRLSANAVASNSNAIASDPRVGALEDALTGRVHSLENEVGDLHRQLEQLATRAASRPAIAVKAPATVSSPAAAPTQTPRFAAERAREPASLLATAEAATRSAEPMRVEVMRTPNQSAPSEARPANPAVAPSSGKSIGLWSVAGALALLLGGAAFVRRRVYGRSSLPPMPLAEHNGLTPSVEPAVSTPAAPQAPVPLEVTAVERADMAKRAAPEPIMGSGVHEHAAGEQVIRGVVIDVEALEHSYLEMGADSLGIDSLVEDTAPHDIITIDPAMAETVVLHSPEVAVVGEIAPRADASGVTESSAAEVTVQFPAFDANAKGARELTKNQGDASRVRKAMATGGVGKDRPRGNAIDGLVLDYDLLELDASDQHVHMPSELHEHVVVTERRTNIADVLKTAIDRDPNRRDLRLKLLETYYGAAATNQRAFLEVVRKASREHDLLSAEDWQRVMLMGREIAAGDALFIDHPKDDDLADCA
ncbi:MAG: hypothetical protein M3N97_09150 [Pseudomonadota bacterium]|nr:hypothetical protein [Pseudomonadota bacterium]